MKIVHQAFIGFRIESDKMTLLSSLYHQPIKNLPDSKIDQFETTDKIRVQNAAHY